MQSLIISLPIFVFNNNVLGHLFSTALTYFFAVSFFSSCACVCLLVISKLDGSSQLVADRTMSIDADSLQRCVVQSVTI